jgi:hypothetical protein
VTPVTGDKVGRRVGNLVGRRVGLFVGGRTGAFVGERIGAFVGRRIGTFVGERIGAVVGGRIGTFVGERIGAVVGERIGVFVGAFDAIVGTGTTTTGTFGADVGTDAIEPVNDVIPTGVGVTIVTVTVILLPIRPDENALLYGKADIVNIRCSCCTT